MDSLAFRAHLAMASKAPPGTQGTPELLEPRASQEKWALQAWAYRARKACVVPLETPDYPDHQASPGLLAPRAPQDKSTVIPA